MQYCHCSIILSGCAINPRHMCEGYCCLLCACLSVTMLGATYLIIYYQVSLCKLSVFSTYVLWILLITLCSRGLVTFAYHLFLLCFLTCSTRDGDGFFSTRLACRNGDTCVYSRYLVQGLHTTITAACLGWIACSCAEGFAQ